MRTRIAPFIAIIGFCAISSCSKSPAPAAAADSTQRANADIQAISTQFKLYQATNGFLPTNSQGINALVTLPTDAPKPQQWRQFLDKIPLDPWQHPYFYKQPGVHNPATFDLYSAGPDGKPDTTDDIGNW